MINFTNTKRILRNHESNDEIGTFDNPNVWKASKNGFYFRIKDEGGKFYLSIWTTNKYYDKKMKRKTEKIYKYSTGWEDNSSFDSFEKTKEFAEKWFEDNLKSKSQ